MTRVQVVSAVITCSDRILLTQRRQNGSFPFEWECPGGKVEGDEAAIVAIQRELQEEIAIKVSLTLIAPWALLSVDFDPPILSNPSTVNFHRVILGADTVPFVIHPREVLGYGWFTFEEAATLPLLPGNRAFFGAFPTFHSMLDRSVVCVERAMAGYDQIEKRHTGS